MFSNKLLLSLFTVLFLVSSHSVSAQTADLLRDINDSYSQFPSESAFALTNNNVVFIAKNSQGFKRIFGTTNNGLDPVIVYDNQDFSTTADTFTATPNYVFFRKEISSFEYELWRTDGTLAGTIPLITNLRNINKMVAIGNKVYFRGQSNTSPFPVNAFVSDGSVVGTLSLPCGVGTSVNPPSPAFVEFKNKVFFSGSIGAVKGLCVTDGTAPGTSVHYQLANEPVNIFPGGNKIYISANNNNAIGTELYAANGDVPNDGFFVKDIFPGANSSDPLNWGGSVLNGFFYFRAKSSETSGFELWKTDGTSLGTTLAADVSPLSGKNSYPRAFGTINNKLIFSADPEGNGADMWKLFSFDGATLTRLSFISAGVDIYNSYLKTNSNNTKAFFYGPNGLLYTTDGTVQGTVAVSDAKAFGVSGGNFWLSSLGNNILTARLIARPQFQLLNDNTLQRSQLGFSTGAITPDSNPEKFVNSSGRCGFTANVEMNGNSRKGVFSTDGNPINTLEAIDSSLLQNDSFEDLFAINSKILLFSRRTIGGNTSIVLTRSHGIPGTDSQVYAFDDHTYGNGFSTGDRLFFDVSHFDSNLGNSRGQIYATDGTSLGTQLIELSKFPPEAVFRNESILHGIRRDSTSFIFTETSWNNIDSSQGDNTNQIIKIVNGFPSSIVTTSNSGEKLTFDFSSNADVTVNSLNTLFFIASTSTSSIAQLFASDGSSFGTLKLTSFIPNGSGYPFISKVIGSVGNSAYFIVKESFTSSALWKSEGSINSTVKIQSFTNVDDFKLIGGNTTGLLSIDSSTYNQDKLFNVTNSGITEIRNFCSINLYQYNTIGESIDAPFFFSADDCTSGQELWKSSGTLGSTSIVDEIYEGTLGSDINDMALCGGSLLFDAKENTVGREPWRFFLEDKCPADPQKLNPGVCGCGVADIDSNSNGNIDCYDSEVNPTPVPTSSPTPMPTVTPEPTFTPGFNPTPTPVASQPTPIATIQPISVLSAPTKVTGKWDKKKKVLNISIPVQTDATYVFQYKIIKAGKKPTKKDKYKKVTGLKNLISIKKLTSGQTVYAIGYYQNSAGISSGSKEAKIKIK